MPGLALCLVVCSVLDDMYDFENGRGQGSNKARDNRRQADRINMKYENDKIRNAQKPDRKAAGQGGKGLCYISKLKC